MLVVVAVALYGIGMVVAGLVLGDHVFEPLGFGPADGDVRTGQQRDCVRLACGILGAVLVGWTVTIGAIVLGPLRRRERWAWWAVSSAAAAWFVFDTGLWLAFGYGGHAAFNVGFALALVVPLAAMRSEVRPVSSPPPETRPK